MIALRFDHEQVGPSKNLTAPLVAYGMYTPTVWQKQKNGPLGGPFFSVQQAGEA
jgi:hypothetical protein